MNALRKTISAAAALVLSCSMSFAQGDFHTVADSLYRAFLSECTDLGSVRQKSIPSGDRAFAHLEEFIGERYTFDASDPNTSKAALDYWMAEVYYDCQDYRKALEQAQYAIDFCRRTTDPILISDCLSILSVSAVRTGDYRVAIEAAEESLEIEYAENDMDRVSSSLNTIAGAYLSMKEYSSARKYIDDAITIQEGLDEPSTLAIRYGMASEIYTGLQQYDKALDFAQKAYEIDLASGSQEKTARRLSQKGAVLLAMDKTKDAEATLNEARAIFEKTGNLNSLAITLNQLGSIEAKKGDMQSARSSYLKAIELTQKTGSMMVESKAHEALASLFEKTEPEFALSHLKTYIEINSKLAANTNEEAAARFSARYESALKDMQIESQKATIRMGMWILVALVILVVGLAGIMIEYKLYYRLKKRNENIIIEAERLSTRLEDLTAQDNSDKVKEELREVSKKLSEIAGGPSGDILTKREKEIALLSCEGLINKEIAAQLGIGLRTVESHKANIYRKLEISNNVELISYVHKAGLIEKKQQNS